MDESMSDLARQRSGGAASTSSGGSPRPSLLRSFSSRLFSSSSSGASKLSQLTKSVSMRTSRSSDSPGKQRRRRKSVSLTSNEEFSFIDCCGVGSSATVMRAWCQPLRKEVAVKKIDLDALNLDLDSFVREAQTMRDMQHPNLLPLLGAFVGQHHLYIVSKYIRGGTLENVLRYAYPQGLPESVLVTVAAATLRALRYLHDHGIVHRDVKASNILLDSDGTVYLGDLGTAARVRKPDDARPEVMLRLQRTTFTGTVPYMSPELVEGAGYGEATDVWSLGVTLVELATGQRPHQGRAVAATLYSVLNDDPPDLPEDDPRFSPQLRDLIHRCLEKDPAKRWTPAQLLAHPAIKRGALDAAHLKREVMPRLPPPSERARIYADQGITSRPRHGGKAADDAHRLVLPMAASGSLPEGGGSGPCPMAADPAYSFGGPASPTSTCSAAAAAIAGSGALPRTPTRPLPATGSGELRAAAHGGHYYYQHAPPPANRMSTSSAASSSTGASGGWHRPMARSSSSGGGGGYNGAGSSSDYYSGGCLAGSSPRGGPPSRQHSCASTQLQQLPPPPQVPDDDLAVEAADISWDFNAAPALLEEERIMTQQRAYTPRMH